MSFKTDLYHAWVITIKEFKQLFRKKQLVVPLFLFPIVMIVFFSYGMGGDVSHASILIVNDDTGNLSHPMIDKIAGFIPRYNGNTMFSLTYTKDMSQSVAQKKIDEDLYKAVLLIPQDYSSNIATNKSVTVTLLTDASDTTTSGIIINFMKQFFSKTGPVDLNIPPVYGDLEYKDFLTPAVIAFVIFVGSVLTTGSAIAGEKQDGTLVRILMTPVSKRAVILGKTIYQLILQILRAALLIAVTFLFIGVKMNGSWLLASLVIIIFTLGGVGLGIVLSTQAKDVDSFFQLNLLTTFPSMFITGVFFPLDSLPQWLRYIAYLMPLTYANHAMRAVMIKGQGLGAISVDLILLSIFALVSFGAGVQLFRREA